MGINSVWGESNARAFLQWADYCQDKALKIKNSGAIGNGYNFATNQFSKEADNAKQIIVDILKKHRQISMEKLYEVLPINLMQNSTTKNLLLDLYTEDHLQIQGQANFNKERETDFILTYVTKPRIEKNRPPIPKPVIKKNIEIKQSNIDEMMENNWTATGRKLDFEKMSKPEKFNTSLKKTVPQNKATNIANERVIVDVRNISPPPKIEPIKIVPRPMIKADLSNIKEIKPNIPNLPTINVAIPKPVVEEKQIVVSPIVDIKPIVNVAPKIQKIDSTVFYGISAFELYTLEAFYKDASRNDKTTSPSENSINSEICKTKGDKLYIENKNNINVVAKFFIFLSCLLIIGIFIVIGLMKNKIRKEAHKKYYKNRKIKDFIDVKNELKEKYPKIINR